MSVFKVLPNNFFSPLASPNKVHYASLLSLFWRTFQEFPRGVERSVIIARYTEYFLTAKEGVTAELDMLTDEQEEDDSSLGLFETDDASESENPRAQATRFLRLLIKTGWMSVEVLEDYTQMINITAWARPFYESLARTEEGRGTEYESHIVAIYSLLCSDAVEENGHYAVLNAHDSTISLNDSLKVLLQSIRDHYEDFDKATEMGEVAQLLHQHYDRYSQAILEGAYKRLKTSENLSKYRPKILKKVQGLKNNKKWLINSAEKLARTTRYSIEECKERMLTMLEEITDVLKGLDPLLSEIDKRNMHYARMSTERIALLIEPDSSITSRLSHIAHYLGENVNMRLALLHKLFRVHVVSPDSRYKRWRGLVQENKFTTKAVVDMQELLKAELALRERLERQLNPAKVRTWLDGLGGGESVLNAETLLRAGKESAKTLHPDVGESASDDSYIKLLYAVLYATSRSKSFGYSIRLDPQSRIQIGEHDVPSFELTKGHP